MSLGGIALLPSSLPLYAISCRGLFPMPYLLPFHAPPPPPDAKASLGPPHIDLSDSIRSHSLPTRWATMAP